ncbi:MAG: ABC transporter permease [Planctomycetota bacterium]
MRHAAIVLAALLGVLGLFAPFLANDVPLLARVGGSYRLPVFESLLGTADHGPDGTTWKQWWLARPEGSEDFAVMPPWATGPLEVHRDAILAGPSRKHPLGVDDAGRDQFTRLLFAARTAFLVAAGVVSIALLLGVVIGGLCGMSGGIVDAVLLRVIEFFASFPVLVAALAGAAFFGGSLVNVVALCALVQWTQIARIVRGELLSLRERPFVSCARGLGVGRMRLLYGHLLPQLRAPMLVSAVFVAADAIQVESALSFLGVGAGPSTVSFGAMLEQGRVHAVGGAWHLWLFPSLALATLVLGLHAVADRLSFRERDTSG